MSQSSEIASVQHEPVSPRRTWEGEEYLPSSSHQTAATPYGEPRGSSGCENTEYWPQIGEVHIKGMTWYAQTLVSSHTKKSAKFFEISGSPLINNNLFMFRLPALCHKTAIKPCSHVASPSPPARSSSLSVI